MRKLSILCILLTVLSYLFLQMSSLRLLALKLQKIAHLLFYLHKKQAGKYNFPAMFLLSCFMFFLLHMHLPVLIRRISIHPFERIDQSSGIRKSAIQRNIQN